MWLVLCSSDDEPALWAACRLKSLGLDPLVVLTPELLLYSLRWEHRLRRDGAISVSFTLADGRRIDGASIRGALNRIPALSADLVSHLSVDDRAYALQEWTALYISWLSSLPVPVLNLPVMQGLGGAWRHQSEWVWLAGRAGLGTHPYVQSASELNSHPIVAQPSPGGVRTVLVIDGEAVDPDLPARTRDACGRLAALAGTRLIGIDLERDTHRFIGASPRPDLRTGGDVLVDALLSVMTGGG